LSGKNLAALEGITGGPAIEPEPASGHGWNDGESEYPPTPGISFECPEHAETLWRCRFCVAAKVVDGSLVPNFMLDLEGEPPSKVSPDDIESAVEGLNDAGKNSIVLFVQVAKWRRKLALD